MTTEGTTTEELADTAGRVDERAVLAIAVAAAVVAVLAGAGPTGTPIVDAALVGLSCGAVVWAAATAPWWTPAAAVGIGAAIALDPAIAAIGVAGFVLGLLDGASRQTMPELRAFVAALAVNVLIRSELRGSLGLSALIGGTLCLLLFVLGVRGRTGTARRGATIGLIVVSSVAILAMVSVGVTALLVRSDLTSANRQARQAIDALNVGDFDRASTLFGQSSAGFARVEDRLGGPLAAPARLVPAVAQNLAAGRELSAAASDAIGVASRALGQIDPSTLRVSGGRLELAAIEAVEAPLLDVQGALRDLEQVTQGIESPWLVARVQQELDELADEFAENEPRLQNAIDAVRAAPAMLGSDGPRRYLVLFTTPSEARGLGGFIGNYAEVTVDDGRIEVTAFDRRSELQLVANDAGARCRDCPEDLLREYGRFGFASGPDGGVGPGVWANLTMPAHFPDVARAAQVLYPQSGGQPIDGVVVMDPFVIQALMQYTGAIEIPELGVVVEPDEAADFLLRQQYVLPAGDGGGNDGGGNDDGDVDVDGGTIDNAERIDALGTLGEAVIARLLTGTLPDPATLGRDLSPLVGERRLLFWTDEATEQDLLDRTGLLGAVPPLPPEGGYSVSVTNGSGSKIEIFLEREVEVRLEGEGDDRRLVAEVRLTNRAPTAGWPEYVIGNVIGLPVGWSRLLVTHYGPDSLVSVTRNGEAVDLEEIAEGGWSGYRELTDLAPGGSVTYRLEFSLPNAADDSGVPVVWSQPLVTR